MTKYKATCDDCGATFTEVYPEGLDGGESYSDPADPKPCDCASQYALGERVDADEDLTPSSYADILDAVTRTHDNATSLYEHLRVTAWILEEMTSTFLMLAFANACDECEDAGTPHPDKPGPGGNFADHPEPTPEVLAEAQAAAVRLYAAILAAPGGYDPAPAVTRWVAAGNYAGDYWAGRRNHDEVQAAARCWGHYAVMSAMGHGVCWEDDNAPLLAGPGEFEGRELSAVRDLRLYADDITWSDEWTDAARAKLDAARE